MGDGMLLRERALGRGVGDPRLRLTKGLFHFPAFAGPAPPPSPHFLSLPSSLLLNTSFRFTLPHSQASASSSLLPSSSQERPAKVEPSPEWPVNTCVLLLLLDSHHPLSGCRPGGLEIRAPLDLEARPPWSSPSCWQHYKVWITGPRDSGPGLKTGRISIPFLFGLEEALII